MSELCIFDSVHLKNFASVVGKTESEGPLASCFDMCEKDEYFGKSTWEEAESEMVHRCINILFTKEKMHPKELDIICGGDLLNQCVASSFGVKEWGVPYLGLYGACSTFGEAVLVGGALVSGGFKKNALGFACSHFCSAEKQYRFPLEYGGQRTPTAQNTVTGCGAVLLEKGQGDIMVKDGLVGRIVDAGITDVNNMGAAMAKAAADTIRRYFAFSGKRPEDFDVIATGDLGREGYELCCELLGDSLDGLRDKYTDCGMMIFDMEGQDVHSGGSGCGCSASVTAGYFLPRIKNGEINRMLLIPTGALMNPTTVFQGQSICGIAHAVCFERG
ncbi:MAG: stage V sporulation protein AD [Clostridia bacterium]|nr:stage V sporulation protein AD [Clostridia bacterium]